MNKKEIEKMVSLADDSYIEEMFTARLYERRHRGAAWIAAAAAIAVAVGAAAVAVNTSDSNKITADLHDLITETETETDTSALESAVTTDFLKYRINCGDYFKNEPDDEVRYYYDQLKTNVGFMELGCSMQFTPEYLDGILRFERDDFRNIAGTAQGDENGALLYAGIRLYNDDTENLPMVHMVFYSDDSPFAEFDKSPYTSEIYGDTALYGFDLSEEKDGSKLLACWRSGDTNYMFASRGLGYDKFIEIIASYIKPNSKGDFTLDSFITVDLKDVIKADSAYKGASEMNRDSVFAGYVPDGSPFAGLSLYGTPQDQNYEEANVGGETIYKRYRQLLVDPESYEIGNGSEKIYISLIYEWGEEPNSDTVINAPVIPFEEITPEKLDEIRIDEEPFSERYMFVIPVNDFTITVLASCEREQLLEAIDAIRSQGGSVTRLSLAEANSEAPFAGYIPRSDSIEGLDLEGVVKDTSKREELRVMYRGENKLRETEYVHLYYSTDGYMPAREVYEDNGEAKKLPPIQITPENLSAESLDGIKKLGSGDLTKHSFYLNINEAGFCIRVEALCSSEKLMKFFEDMGVLQVSGAEIDSETEKLPETVMFNGREYPRDIMSEDTLEWLERYNSLSEDERFTTSFVPPEIAAILEEEARRERETEEALRKREAEKIPETVTYHGREFQRTALSEETLEWLEWYNSLSEEEQLAISYEPAELR